MGTSTTISWVTAYEEIASFLLYYKDDPKTIWNIFWTESDWCFKELLNTSDSASNNYAGSIFYDDQEKEKPKKPESIGITCSPFVLSSIYNGNYFVKKNPLAMEMWKNIILTMIRKIRKIRKTPNDESIEIKTPSACVDDFVYTYQANFPKYLYSSNGGSGQVDKEKNNKSEQVKKENDFFWKLLEIGSKNDMNEISSYLKEHRKEIKGFELTFMTGFLHNMYPSKWVPFDENAKTETGELMYSGYSDFMGKVVAKANGTPLDEYYRRARLNRTKEIVKHNKQGSTNTMSTKDELDNLIAKLKANGQLILTGAPGTGKTYKAKEIAATLLQCTQEDLKSNPQYAFVQFHPGYDYSDFVEGLKPQPCGTGITFERSPGIFKRFCECVHFDFDAQYKYFWNMVKNKKILTVETRSGKSLEVRIKDESDPLTGFTTNSKDYKTTKEKFEEIYKKYSTKDALDSIEKIDGELRNGVKGLEVPSAVWAIMKAILSLDLPYVFVIDEINRADLSRVFGELFSGLEIEYRGTPIRTQYSYLKEEGEADFTIPKNVYIIGTMNDIDRSVESMDFALRRRFAWHEITAKDSVSILEQCISDPQIREDAEAKMKAVNRYIGPWDEDDAEVLKLDEKTTTSLNLGREYQLGGAYFKKISKYKKENGEPDWDALWSNHIEVILREYLRGRKDAEKILKALHGEYNKAGSTPSAQPDSEQPTANQNA